MSEPARVLYLAHSVAADGGGMERMGRALVTADGTGAVFTVVACEGLEGLPADVRTVRVALPRRPAFARIAWYYLRSGRVVRALRASHDVVHSCGAITPERVDVATIHLCHAAVTNTWGRGGPGWRRANAALAGWLGRAIELRQLRGGGVSEVVAVSSQVARELTTHYPSVPHSTIPNGVDSPAAAPTRRDGSGPLAALMVTSDFATKGVELAIGALQFAPGVVLTVVGRGGAKPYEALARRIGVGDRVTFAGFVTDPNPYYRACDVVVCASHYEAFGLFLVEAALAGCAVVSTDVGVAPELVDGGAGGVIVERTPEAVGRALSACAADRAGTICRGEAARERAARFTTDAMAEGYGALYQRLTAAAAP